MALFIWLSIIVVILSYLYATRKFDYWQKLGVPFDKPLPFIGSASLVLFKHSLGSFLKEIYEKFDSPLVGFFLFDQPQLVVRDPKIIKVILIEEFDKFVNRTTTTNLRDDPVGTQVLFALKNPQWKPIRQKMTAIFTTGKMKLMFPLLVEVGHSMLKYVNKNSGVSIDAKELSVRYTTDVIASCAFGVNAQSFEREDTDFRFISKNMLKFTWKTGIQMTCYFISPFLVKLFRMKFLEPRCCKMLQNIFWDVLDKRRRTTTKRNDLIDILIELQNEKADHGEVKFDGDIVVAQAVQFYAAGYETSGSATCFGLYELALHPDVQDTLRKEIKETVARHHGITYEAVQEMKYLHMVVQETLRKYPVVPFLDRRALENFHIPGTKVTVEKGTAVFIPTMGLHYDPNYFPEPEKFKPERFTTENKANIPSCVNLSFGDGPRNCVGSRFGLLSVKLSFINILSEFEVLPSDDTPSHITFDPRAFLLATALPVKIQFKKLKMEA